MLNSSNKSKLILSKTNVYFLEVFTHTIEQFVKSKKDIIDFKNIHHKKLMPHSRSFTACKYRQYPFNFFTFYSLYGASAGRKKGTTTP